MKTTMQINNEEVDIEYSYEYDTLIPENQGKLEIEIINSPLPEEFDREIEQAIREELEGMRDDHTKP
jgi:hypothetical protein